MTQENAARIPASITDWIFSLGPSVRYDSAQQPSESTSRSVWRISSDSAGRHWHTALKGGGGFLLRHRFDSVQVTLRRNGIDVWALMWCNNGSRQPLLSTWSRRSGPSPDRNTFHGTHCHVFKHSYWHPHAFTTYMYLKNMLMVLWISALHPRLHKRHWKFIQLLIKLKKENYICAPKPNALHMFNSRSRDCDHSPLWSFNICLASTCSDLSLHQIWSA